MLRPAAAAAPLLLLLPLLVALALAAPLVAAEVPQSLLYFFPSECPTANRTCCPVSHGATCGGSVRGQCELLFDDDNVCVASVDDNVGQWWVTTYFDSGCTCNGNYWGVACETCKPGYTGDDCSTKAEVRIRRDFASLADVDKQYVLDSFVLLKNTPSPFQPEINWFDYIAGSHYWSMKDTAAPDYDQFPHLSRGGIDPGHDGPAAPVYHRRLVFELERALRTATNNDSWTMPYWNWTSTPGNSNDETLLWFGGDGTVATSNTTGESCRWYPETLLATDKPAGCDCELTEGPFAGWSLIGLWGNARAGKVVQRAIGCQSRFGVSAPSQSIGNFIGSVPYYYSETNTSWSFRQLLGGGVEGAVYTWPGAQGTGEMHKRVHRWLGGTMVGNSTASDPLFYMLHGYADLVLERWIRNAEARGWYDVNNSWPITSTPNSHNRGDCTAPYLPLQKHIDWWKNSEELGYTFDFFSDCEHSGRTDCSIIDFEDFTYPEPMDFADTVDHGLSVAQNETIFFPSGCTGSTCCPAYNGSVCGGSVRGTCASPVNSSTVCDVGDVGLAGLWWLTSSYEQVCICNDNYWGADCSACRPGYEGDDCSTVSELRTRRDFSSLSTVEMQAVADAFGALKMMAHPMQPGINAYDYLVGLTVWWRNVGASSTGTGDMSKEGTHGAYSGAGTLTAHRRILLEIESLMRLATDDDTFNLPYWKWDDSMSNDNDAALRWFGGDGLDAASADTGCRYSIGGAYNCNCSLDRGVFRHWSLVSEWGASVEDSTLTRGFGCLSAAPTLPISSMVDDALLMPAYHASDASTSFWKSLSGQKNSNVQASQPVSDYDNWDLDGHARVMLWLAGTQMQVEAASDPIWFMHVAYADLLFDRWIRNAIDFNQYHTWPSSGLTAGNNLNECVPGFFPLQTNAELYKPSTAHGYTYDFFSSSSSSSSTSSDSGDGIDSSESTLTASARREVALAKNAASKHAARVAAAEAALAVRLAALTTKTTVKVKATVTATLTRTASSAAPTAATHVAATSASSTSSSKREHHHQHRHRNRQLRRMLNPQ